MRQGSTKSKIVRVNKKTDFKPLINPAIKIFVEGVALLFGNFWASSLEHVPNVAILSRSIETKFYKLHLELVRTLFLISRLPPLKWNNNLVRWELFPTTTTTMLGLPPDFVFGSFALVHQNWIGMIVAAEGECIKGQVEFPAHPELTSADDVRGLIRERQTPTGSTEWHLVAIDRSERGSF